MLSLLSLFVSVLHACNAYKFLVYSPIFGHSHSTFMGRIADILYEHGHEVTVLMPVVEDSLINMTGVKSGAKQVIVGQDSRTKELMDYNKKNFYVNFWTMKTDAYSLMKSMTNWTLSIKYTCDNLIRDKDLLDTLRNENFDVGLAEPIFGCGFGLFKYLGLQSIISTVSNVHHEAVSQFIGEPFPTSYVPFMFSGEGDQMNTFQRLWNTLNTGFMIKMSYDMFAQEEEILVDVLGKEYGNIKDVVGTSSVVFTNANPYLDFPRPLLHKTVQIGGVSVNLERIEKVDKRLGKILDERPQTVLISFGSVCKSKDMPIEWKKSIIDVCRSLPNITFIWKYEEHTSIADGIPNLYLEPWLPQTSLLADPRLSLFITHGGLGSTTELAHIGKAAIMIPIFADQMRNAPMLARHGGAVVLDKNLLGNPETLKITINKLLDDESYAAAAKKLSEMLRNQPVSPTDLVVKHSEFVARFGPLEKLNPYGRHLNIFQYYLIDVLAVLVLALISIILVPFVTLRCLRK